MTVDTVCVFCGFVCLGTLSIGIFMYLSQFVDVVNRIAFSASRSMMTIIITSMFEYLTTAVTLRSLIRYSNFTIELKVLAVFNISQLLVVRAILILNNESGNE